MGAIEIPFIRIIISAGRSAWDELFTDIRHPPPPSPPYKSVNVNALSFVQTPKRSEVYNCVHLHASLGCSVSSDTNCVLVSSFLLPGGSHLVYSLPLKSRQGLALNVANKKQTKKKNELFYVLFLRTGAHSPLQSKEPKQSKQTSASTCARAHTHTHARAHTHTHKVNRY